MYYDIIDVSKGVYHTKSNKSRECMIFHYWFFNHGLEFQCSLCNGCHDLLMLCLNISDIVSLLLKMLIIVVLFITLANLQQLIY